MKTIETNSTKYITVGALAKEANVTIRTLQFYDQKGLLSPSAKGPRNQRLYTEEDKKKLYRILCYKYMGLSLEEIRTALNNNDTTSDMSKALHQKVQEIENLIFEQMKRYAILKDLESHTSESADDIDWLDFSKAIDYIQAKWEMIWQFNRAYESGSTPTDFSNVGREDLKNYFKLMSNIISLMNQGVSPEDESVKKLILDYIATQGTDLLKAGNDVMKMNTVESAVFWSDIKNYMNDAMKHSIK